MTYPDIHNPDKQYYEAGYQLGNWTQGFPIWISARSHKGEVFAASDQSQTCRNPAAQPTLPWRSRQLFFNNMKNSNTSSRPKATMLLQQKSGKNAGRKLLTLLMRKFVRSYNINLSDNINGQHSDHTMSLYYGTDVSGRALPQWSSFHSHIKLV